MACFGKSWVVWNRKRGPLRALRRGPPIIVQARITSGLYVHRRCLLRQCRRAGVVHRPMKRHFRRSKTASRECLFVLQRQQIFLFILLFILLGGRFPPRVGRFSDGGKAVFHPMGKEDAPKSESCRTGRDSINRESKDKKPAADWLQLRYFFVAAAVLFLCVYYALFTCPRREAFRVFICDLRGSIALRREKIRAVRV